MTPRTKGLGVAPQNRKQAPGEQRIGHDQEAQRTIRISIADQLLLDVLGLSRIPMVMQVDSLADPGIRGIGPQQPYHRENQVAHPRVVLEVERVNRVMLDFVRNRRKKREHRDANPRRNTAADIEQDAKAGSPHHRQQDDKADGRLVLKPWMALDKAGAGMPNRASDLQFGCGLPRRNAAGVRKFLFRSCYTHHPGTAVVYRRPLLVVKKRFLASRITILVINRCAL